MGEKAGGRPERKKDRKEGPADLSFLPCIIPYMTR